MQKFNFIVSTKPTDRLTGQELSKAMVKVYKQNGLQSYTQYIKYPSWITGNNYNWSIICTENQMLLIQLSSPVPLEIVCKSVSESDEFKHI
jgi:hypothetical protein